MVKIKFVVLASKPVGGRSRATELPCFIYFRPPHWRKTRTIPGNFSMLNIQYMNISDVYNSIYEQFQESVSA